MVMWDETKITIGLGRLKDKDVCLGNSGCDFGVWAHYGTHNEEFFGSLLLCS